MVVCTSSGVLTFRGLPEGPGFDHARLAVGVPGEKVVFFDQPVDFQPMVQAVFLTGIVRYGVRLSLHVEDRFEECGHNRLRFAALEWE